MRRAGVLLALVIGFGAIGVIGVEAAKKKKHEPAAAAPAAIPTAPETIVHTFGNEDEMKGFAKLWQQRQGTIVRMSVLRAYWDEEQAALAKLNSQVTTEYHLDPAKNYTLDAKRRVLIELPAEPAASPEATGSAPTEPPKP